MVCDCAQVAERAYVWYDFEPLRTGDDSGRLSRRIDEVSVRLAGSELIWVRGLSPAGSTRGPGVLFLLLFSCSSVYVGSSQYLTEI